MLLICNKKYFTMTDFDYYAYYYYNNYKIISIFLKNQQTFKKYTYIFNS